MPDSLEGQVTLQANATIDGGQLVITYRVLNGREVDLALMNRPFERDVDGGRWFDPSSCFVDIEPGTLHVAQMLMPIPDDLSVAAMVLPGVTRVTAGGEHAHRIVLPLPVEACNPHRRAWLAMRGHPRQPIGLVDGRQVDVVVLSVGYIALTDGQTVEPMAGAPSDVMQLRCVDPQARQQVLEANLRLDESVAALDYGPIVPPSPTPQSSQPEAP